ncbi:hypothetical protein SF12_04400 [Streptomyces sp. MBRL 601]|uniref:Uncharacterized protein n=1 Tax=Streptomyces koyangensis TaxID=188770 RepID=A0A385DFX7_9ACTN|nr:hypothetical protein D0C37_21305 [Streptomyces koyangensis]KIX79550.1 hypothetical protein SF12_04400 [Streptomyces sp. MBRL 601]
MTAWVRPRGRPERANDISRATTASWGFLGLLLLGVSAYAITDGATRLGLLGQRQEARVMECSAQGGGRGQTSHACLVELAPERTREPVRVRFNHPPADTTPLARSPWGTWLPVDEGFVAGTTRALFCVLPLTASGVCFRLACAGRGSG